MFEENNLHLINELFKDKQIIKTLKNYNNNFKDLLTENLENVVMNKIAENRNQNFRRLNTSAIPKKTLFPILENEEPKEIDSTTSEINSKSNSTKSIGDKCNYLFNLDIKINQTPILSNLKTYKLPEENKIPTPPKILDSIEDFSKNNRTIGNMLKRLKLNSQKINM